MKWFIAIAIATVTLVPACVSPQSRALLQQAAATPTASHSSPIGTLAPTPTATPVRTPSSYPTTTPPPISGMFQTVTALSLPPSSIGVGIYLNSACTEAWNSTNEPNLSKIEWMPDPTESASPYTWKQGTITVCLWNKNQIAVDVDVEDNLRAALPGFSAHSNTLHLAPGERHSLTITIEESTDVLRFTGANSFNIWFNTQASTSQPALTPMPQPTRTPTQANNLASELPSDVYLSFKNDFYGACSEPPFADLHVVKTWTGQGNNDISITDPPGTYFIAVSASPIGSSWFFKSVYETSDGEKFNSLYLDRSIPSTTADSQKWCGSGPSTIPDTLHIRADNIEWTLYLIAPENGTALPKSIQAALQGYYGACPALPPINQIGFAQTWTSASVGTAGEFGFNAYAPWYFLGVRFQPQMASWGFASTDTNGSWSTSGPHVSSASGERIDFTATCPSTLTSDQLKVSSQGGNWTIYLLRETHSGG